ncbi:MAG: chloramphenicol acetyltransferase [Bacteroidota bacterium]
MRFIDMENWNRKEHFEFFSGFDNPFYGMVTEVDCTETFYGSKTKGVSLFANYLHKSLLAMNTVEEMKMRIKDDRVVIFDQIHASATIGREDGTFGFSFIHQTEDFYSFTGELKEETQAVQESTGLRNNKDAQRLDVIHYSAIPWSKFTGLTHASNFGTDDSVPKITFGRIFTRDDKKILPLSIDVHHGLVDALHISQFLSEFQTLLNKV